MGIHKWNFQRASVADPSGKDLEKGLYKAFTFLSVKI